VLIVADVSKDRDALFKISAMPRRPTEFFLVTFTFKKEALSFSQPHYGLEIESASKRNEYQEYPVGGKVKPTWLGPQGTIPREY
jgi:hypothetical protein